MPAWDYGFPELKGQKEKIQNSYRVAVPGCYASGFISIARPLVELGLVPAEYPFSLHRHLGLLRRRQEDDRRVRERRPPGSQQAGCAQELRPDAWLTSTCPRCRRSAACAHTPAFVPVVCDYYCGMQVLVPLDLKPWHHRRGRGRRPCGLLTRTPRTVNVHGLNEPLPENGLYSNALSGSDRMELYLTVNAAGDQMMLISLFDNLGKGSSGAAVQCMNLMLGLNETARAWNNKKNPLSHLTVTAPPKGELLTKKKKKAKFPSC